MDRDSIDFAQGRAGSASALASAFASIGVYLGKARSEVRCPRHDWGLGTPLYVNLDSGVYRCGHCCVAGRGLRSLLVNLDLFRVPLSENEYVDIPFGELGHCPDAKRPTYLHASQPRARSVLWLCNSWTCRYCGFLVRRARYGHFGARLLDAGPEVYFGQIEDASRWDAVRKAVQRRRGQYLRCPQPDGSLKVFSTVPFRGSLAVPTAFRPTDYNLLWESLYLALRSTGESPLNLSSSAPWAFGRSQQMTLAEWGIESPTADEWEIAVMTNAEWTEALRAAESAGLVTASDRSRVAVEEVDGRADPDAFNLWQLMTGLRTRAVDAERRKAWLGSNDPSSRTDLP